MNKHTALRENLSRDFKHLNKLKLLYKKKYRKRQDPVLLRALRRREIELVCIEKEIGEFVSKD